MGDMSCYVPSHIPIYDGSGHQSGKMDPSLSFDFAMLLQIRIAFPSRLLSFLQFQKQTTLVSNRDRSAGSAGPMHLEGSVAQ